jgi:hypothetical protein
MRSSSTLAGAIAEGWRLLSIRASAPALCEFAAPVLAYEEIVDLPWTGEIKR